MSENKFKCAFQVSGKVLEVCETQTFASGFQKRSVIIEASRDAEKFSNPVEVTLKKESCTQGDALHIGDFIEVEGYVEGRRWDGPKGVRHFIDLSVKSLIVTERAALPTSANNWKELVELGAAYGENEDAVKGRAKALGKGFKEMQTADWQKLAADIVAAHAVTTPKNGEPAAAAGDVWDGDPDDMPF